LCGSLSIGGRDVGAILIGEGLAHSYVCGDDLSAAAAVVLDSPASGHAFVIGRAPACGDSNAFLRAMD
jgi:hypothetical protein